MTVGTPATSASGLTPRSATISPPTGRSRNSTLIASDHGFSPRPISLTSAGPRELRANARARIAAADNPSASLWDSTMAGWPGRKADMARANTTCGGARRSWSDIGTYLHQRRHRQGGWGLHGFAQAVSNAG